ncbi:MAG: acyl-ACP--UDP-N-acetylglucosamine O-acyltransferase [Verrucomicrobiota bacterium]
MIIHSNADVSDLAVIGEGTEIGARAVVEPDVKIGRNCKLAALSIVRSGTVLEDGVTVDSFAVIGGDPQSLDFDVSTESGVLIGEGTMIREGVTISRSTVAGSKTVIGPGCFLMAQSHVGHDCVLGEAVVMANNVMLGGHVQIGDKTFIGGGAGIHQFCRIGMVAMVAGNASITADVPPYVMAAERSEAHGLNLVGIRRANLSRADIADLKRCYRAVYLGGGNLKKKAAEAAREHEFSRTAAGARFLSFFESGKRGFVRSTRNTSDSD